ncbi:hypothetical protein ACFPTO_17865 [Paraburkholderia denitrificans]|uniref:Uncharacterized protein n=1 Tax=Paraburkholderia denitrificans TaxID=694025 RepID=A0ABW0JBZ2_9BURK
MENEAGGLATRRGDTPRERRMPDPGERCVELPHPRYGCIAYKIHIKSIYLLESKHGPHPN